MGVNKGDKCQNHISSLVLDLSLLAKCTPSSWKQVRIYFDLTLSALKASNDRLLQNIAFQQIVLHVAKQEINLSRHTVCYVKI